MNSIFVTGASGGIGAAVSTHFLEQGWHVGLFARRKAALDALAEGHAKAQVFEGDVSDEAAINTAVSDFAQSAGGLGVLFNNAGIFAPPALIDEMDVSDWRNAIDVNLTGMFLAARAAFGVMRHQSPRGGRIINNGSVSAHVPRPGAASYTASKHGVTGLTRQISLDGRDLNIACGQIDIGNVRSPMLEDLASKSAEPIAMMDMDAVIQAVSHMATLPLHANVQFMTVMATQMPYIGRG